MKYEEFKEAFTKEVRRQAGEETRIQLQKVTKNNGISKDAISITKKECAVAPVIYLDSFYESYQKGYSMVHLAACLLANYRNLNETLTGIDTSFFSEYENAKKHIYCRLVNIEMNREILNKIPYRTYLDLAVVYYYMSDVVKAGEATILISETHRELWGITKEELDRQAWQNTLSDLKPKLQPMQEILEEILDEEEKEEAKLSRMLYPMYVLSNQKKTFGAICIRYPGILEQAAMELGGDFYILPSSVHECILIPVSSKAERETLKEMVSDINRTQVEPQEILANQVYLYHHRLQKIIF